MGKRLFNILVFISLFLVEVFIALFVHDKIVRPYVGDIIVVMVIYFFVRSFFTDGVRFLIPSIFLFAVLVEFLQLIHIVDILGLSDFTLARVVIGTSFSMIDILCYLVGCLLLYAYEFFVKRIHGT